MRISVLVLLASVVVAGAGPGLVGTAALAQEEGTVVGRPNLDLSATDNRFGPGEQATLELFVSNNGDIDRGGPAEYEQRVTTARNVRLEIDETRMDEALARRIEVQTGTVFAGSVPEGSAGPFAVNLEISDSLAPGTYELPVRVSYDYTNFVRYGPNIAPEYNDGSQTTTKYVTVVVEDRPQFEVRTRNATRVTAGDSATYRLDVTNTGTTPAIDAQLSLSAANSSVFFGGTDAPRPGTSVFLDRLDPGETRSFEVTVGANADTAPGTYLATGIVNYEKPNGVSERSKRLSFGVVVGREQRFEMRGVDSTLRVGDEGVVTGRVVNTGGAPVSEAVVVLAGDDSNFAPRSTEFAVGSLAPGEAANVSFRIATANETDPGPRRLTFRVEYRNPAGESRTSDPIDARVAVAREPTFGVDATGTGLQVGDSGIVSGTVVNTGETEVSDAVVLLQTEGTNLQPRTPEFAVGNLSPGESANFEFEVMAANDTDPGFRQVSFRIRYRSDDGDRRYSDALDANVRVGAEQRFDVEAVESDLRVGEAGDLTGQVVNAGNRTVSSAVVVLQTNNPTLDARETEVAVGRLEPGEAAPFQFTVDVIGEAEPGPRLVSFRVRYRNADGDLRVSDAVDARVDVAEDVDEFRVEPINATVAAGSSEVVTFRITNAANGTLRDVEAKLFTSDPLSSDNDEAFVSALDPGESATLAFRVGVAGGAIPKAYPVSMDFTYEDERGDTVLSETYRVPVEVTERQRRGLPIPADVPPSALVVAGVGFVALALLWWKRGAVGRLFT